jgi:hypothetical protein
VYKQTSRKTGNAELQSGKVVDKSFSLARQAIKVCSKPHDTIDKHLSPEIDDGAQSGKAVVHARSLSGCFGSI